MILLRILTFMYKSILTLIFKLNCTTYVLLLRFGVLFNPGFYFAMMLVAFQVLVLVLFLSSSVLSE